MIQNSCSELLMDTSIHDPKIAYKRFTKLFQEYEWTTDPLLSIQILKELIDGIRHEIIVEDKYGHRAWIQYGSNGYITTGFRFDSECNDWDRLCYPIFKVAIEQLDGELIACDGGKTQGYNEWYIMSEILSNIEINIEKFEKYITKLYNENDYYISTFEDILKSSSDTIRDKVNSNLKYIEAKILWELKK